MLYMFCPIPSRSSSPFFNRVDLADDLSGLAAELSNAVEDFAEQRRKLRHLQQRKQQQKEPICIDLHCRLCVFYFFFSSLVWGLTKLRSS